MNEKQNRSGSRVTLMCANCGGARFIRREDLTEDQLIVAERTDWSGMVTGNHSVMFCARCLYPVGFPDPRA